jgi:hypothetical protein
MDPDPKIVPDVKFKVPSTINFPLKTADVPPHVKNVPYFNVVVDKNVHVPPFIWELPFPDKFIVPLKVIVTVVKKKPESIVEIEFEIKVLLSVHNKDPPLLIIILPGPNNFPEIKDKIPDIVTSSLKLHDVPPHISFVPGPMVT